MNLIKIFLFIKVIVFKKEIDFLYNHGANRCQKLLDQPQQNVNIFLFITICCGFHKICFFHLFA